MTVGVESVWAPVGEAISAGLGAVGAKLGDPGVTVGELRPDGAFLVGARLGDPGVTVG